MSATISLGGSKNLTVRAAQTATLTEVTVLRWVDKPAEKVVLAFVQELNNPVTLWADADYDSIGDWTEAQASTRLAAVINAM
jgi:hypothetical protein